MTKDKRDDIIKTGQLITTIVGIIGILWTLFYQYNHFMDRIESIEISLEDVERSELINTIHNKELDMPDRVRACDRYLGKGYNSLTERYCRNLVDEIFEEE